MTILFLPMAPGLERAQRLATQLVSGGASAAVPRHFDVPPGLVRSTVVNRSADRVNDIFWFTKVDLEPFTKLHFGTVTGWGQFPSIPSITIELPLQLVVATKLLTSSKKWWF